MDRENSGSKSPPVPAPHRSIRREGAGKERDNDQGKSDADREKSAPKPQPVPAPRRPVTERPVPAWMYSGEYQCREVNSTVPQSEWAKRANFLVSLHQMTLLQDCQRLCQRQCCSLSWEGARMLIYIIEE